MAKITPRRILGLCLLVAVSAMLRAESKPEAAAPAKSETPVIEEPVLSVTAHTITVGGKTLKYHATAGYLLLKEEEGKPLVPGVTPPRRRTRRKPRTRRKHRRTD